MVSGTITGRAAACSSRSSSRSTCGAAAPTGTSAARPPAGPHRLGVIALASSSAASTALVDGRSTAAGMVLVAISTTRSARRGRSRRCPVPPARPAAWSRSASTRPAGTRDRPERPIGTLRRDRRVRAEPKVCFRRQPRKQPVERRPAASAAGHAMLPCKDLLHAATHRDGPRGPVRLLARGLRRPRTRSSARPAGEEPTGDRPAPRNLRARTAPQPLQRLAAPAHRAGKLGHLRQLPLPQGCGSPGRNRAGPGFPPHPAGPGDHLDDVPFPPTSLIRGLAAGHPAAPAGAAPQAAVPRSGTPARSAIPPAPSWSPPRSRRQAGRWNRTGRSPCAPRRRPGPRRRPAGPGRDTVTRRPPPPP